MTREVLEVADHERGPAGLMARAEAAAVFAVKIFVEKHEVLPVGITGETRVVAVTGALKNITAKTFYALA